MAFVPSQPTYTSQPVTLQNYFEIDGKNNGVGTFGSFRLDKFIPVWITNEWLENELGAVRMTEETNYYYETTNFGYVTEATQSRAQLLAGANNLVDIKLYLALPNHWYQYGYWINALTPRTMAQWNQILGYREANLALKRQQFQINKALYTIYRTCLATGNFKVFPALDLSNLAEPTANQDMINAFFKIRLVHKALRMKWTSQFEGIPNERITLYFNPFIKELALQSLIGTPTGNQGGNQTLLVSDKAYDRTENGEIVKWFGIDLKENMWLGQNRFQNKDAATADGTGEYSTNWTNLNFDFTNCLGLIYSWGTIEQIQRTPLFVDQMSYPTGFVPSGDVTNQYTRTLQWTQDCFITPFLEGMNVALLFNEPLQAEVQAARTELNTNYPTLYTGLKATLTTEVYNQMIANAKSWQAYAPESNPYGLTNNNTAGIPVQFGPKKVAAGGAGTNAAARVPTQNK